MLTQTIPDLFAEAGSCDLFACLTAPEDQPKQVPPLPIATRSPNNADFGVLHLKARTSGIAGMTEREKALYRDLLSRMKGAETPDQPSITAGSAVPSPKLALPLFVARTPVRAFAAVVSDTPPPDAIPAIDDVIAQLLDRGAEGRVLQCEAGQAAFTNARARLQIIDVIDDPRALAIAELVHPAARMLPKQTQRMLAAAARQLFGPSLDTTVGFLLVWTQDACDRIEARTRETGFAGDVMALASLSGIPVVNLAGTDAARKLRALLSPNQSEEYHAQH